MTNWRYSDYQETYFNLDHFVSIYLVDSEEKEGPFAVEGIDTKGCLQNFFIGSDYNEALDWLYDFIRGGDD